MNEKEDFGSPSTRVVQLINLRSALWYSQSKTIISIFVFLFMIFHLFWNSWCNLFFRKNTLDGNDRSL